MARKVRWTEEDLLGLRGVPESARLDFKRSRLLDRGRNDIADNLSKEISAFANSEGGLIVIGMVERKDGKSRIADDLDEGIVPKDFHFESFQQLLEGNVSPYLPGIRFFKVPLSASRVGRMAIVIDVPQGSTAYQAADKRYYGRSEYESIALPDHEIRMRMMRGRLPRMTLGLFGISLETALAEYEGRQAELRRIQQSRDDLEFMFIRSEHREQLEAPRRNFDRYSFRSRVVNVGEMSVRDLVLTVAVTTRFEVTQYPEQPSQLYAVELRSGRYRFAQPARRYTSSGESEWTAPEGVLFPGDHADFPSKGWTVDVPDGVVLSKGDVVIEWTIYLDNAPSISDKLDLYDAAMDEGRAMAP